MTFARILAAALIATAAPVSSQPAVAGVDARVDQLIAAMTRAEKLKLIFGYATGEQATRGFTPPPGAYPGSAGYIPGIARLGLPPLWESDSGIGVSGVGPAAEKRGRTALPSSLAIAASWDPALAMRGGAMIGGEARASGYNVLLAGSAVLVREPRSGRNFENSGEDPLLNGVITGAQIRGVQSAGVISTLKHFAVNAQEPGESSSMRGSTRRRRACPIIWRCRSRWKDHGRDRSCAPTTRSMGHIVARTRRC
ncbi:MAG TPA: glycoside hydrolase family 3 N-terminal domain-containing protein [Sphingomonas sp.]|jgi:beta-glucosidase|uniref:glycoside hydrolase family 3 N-terminal domain-containing protein n=1 Tax=Sphingomonas sp. TaxID=28214 RepID=UPI002ED8D3DC